jgi:hypothetical protein
MEEDIERLEYLLKVNRTLGQNMSEENLKAIENLIKRNKELEEERQIVGMPVKNKRDGKIGIILHKWENGNIAVLERISPRIINTHDSFNTLEIITDEVKQKTEQDSILKLVIKEKIEEVNKRIEKYREYTEQGIETDVEWVDNVADRQIIQILKELLEGK